MLWSLFHVRFLTHFIHDFINRIRIRKIEPHISINILLFIWILTFGNMELKAPSVGRCIRWNKYIRHRCKTLGSRFILFSPSSLFLTSLLHKTKSIVCIFSFSSYLALSFSLSFWLPFFHHQILPSKLRNTYIISVFKIY